MIDGLKELYEHRELFRMWTWREIKIRYKQSFLGVAWAILQPVALMIVFTAVFSFFARVPTDGIPYPIFSYAALLPWTFFATSISFAVPSLVSNMSMVTKIYFPREILPLAAVAAALVDFLVASLVFGALVAWYRWPLGPSLLWLPCLVAIQVMLTAGLALIASALNVWYRDIRFVVPLAVQIWMYLSPIIYPISLVPARWRTLYMLNPLAGLIDSYRRVVLEGRPPQFVYLALSAAVGLILLIGGYAYFKHSEAYFADVI